METSTRDKDVTKGNSGENVLIEYLKSTPVGVKISGLDKSFGGNHVLRNIDLEIEPGETLVILGKSGSGKSVLLRHIVGLLKPDSGRIVVNGVDVRNEDVKKKHTIAMVFQSSALFNSLSVKENIALYLREHGIFKDEDKIERIVKSSLSVVGLEGKENIMPSELSGGMKKRVAVARALVMNPDLILFDEPTAELDPIMTKAIGDVILGLKEHVEVTQIVVTHEIDLAFYIADRIAVLSEGRIIQVGTPEEIRKSSNPVVQNFITPQFDREEQGGSEI